MKRLSGLLIMLILVPAHAQWEEYSRSPDGDMVHYYDATQLVRAQNTFKLPIKVEYAPPVVSLRSDLRVASGIMNYEFDCTNKKVRVLSIEGFTMPNLKGELSLTSSELPDSRRGHLNRWTSYEDEPHYKPVVSRFCS
jgi:hypothetical protein